MHSILAQCDFMCKWLIFHSLIFLFIYWIQSNLKWRYFHLYTYWRPAFSIFNKIDNGQFLGGFHRMHPAQFSLNYEIWFSSEVVFWLVGCVCRYNFFTKVCYIIDFCTNVTITSLSMLSQLTLCGFVLIYHFLTSTHHLNVTAWNKFSSLIRDRGRHFLIKIEFFTTYVLVIFLNSCHKFSVN